tara:strand:+ start:245 stop:634 length:390 start_codon:yes stop_codon:yes gene_type:complete
MVFDDENQRSRSTSSVDDDRPMFYIGVVAQITGTHPQTLRNYERIGLVRPERSQGAVRMYSNRDVDRVQRIRRLTQQLGANLAGVEMILNLTDRIERMQHDHEIEFRAMQQRHADEIRRLKEMLARITS